MRLISVSVYGRLRVARAAVNRGGTVVKFGGRDRGEFLAPRVFKGVRFALRDVEKLTMNVSLKRYSVFWIRTRSRDTRTRLYDVCSAALAANTPRKRIYFGNIIVCTRRNII